MRYQIKLAMLTSGLLVGGLSSCGENFSDPPVVVGAGELGIDLPVSSTTKVISGLEIIEVKEGVRKFADDGFGTRVLLNHKGQLTAIALNPITSINSFDSAFYFTVILGLPFHLDGESGDFKPLKDQLKTLPEFNNLKSKIDDSLVKFDHIDPEYIYSELLSSRQAFYGKIGLKYSKISVTPQSVDLNDNLNDMTSVEITKQSKSGEGYDLELSVRNGYPFPVNVYSTLSNVPIETISLKEGNSKFIGITPTMSALKFFNSLTGVKVGENSTPLPITFNALETFLKGTVGKTEVSMSAKLDCSRDTIVLDNRQSEIGIVSDFVQGALSLTNLLIDEEATKIYVQYLIDSDKYPQIYNYYLSKDFIGGAQFIISDFLTWVSNKGFEDYLTDPKQMKKFLMIYSKITNGGGVTKLASAAFEVVDATFTAVKAVYIGLDIATVTAGNFMFGNWPNRGAKVLKASGLCEPQQSIIVTPSSDVELELGQPYQFTATLARPSDKPVVWNILERKDFYWTYINGNKLDFAPFLPGEYKFSVSNGEPGVITPITVKARELGLKASVQLKDNPVPATKSTFISADVSVSRRDSVAGSLELVALNTATNRETSLAKQPFELTQSLRSTSISFTGVLPLNPGTYDIYVNYRSSTPNSFPIKIDKAETLRVIDGDTRYLNAASLVCPPRLIIDSAEGQCRVVARDDKGNDISSQVEVKYGYEGRKASIDSTGKIKGLEETQPVPEEPDAPAYFTAQVTYDSKTLPITSNPVTISHYQQFYCRPVTIKMPDEKATCTATLYDDNGNNVTSVATFKFEDGNPGIATITQTGRNTGEVVGHSQGLATFNSIATYNGQTFTRQANVVNVTGTANPTGISVTASCTPATIILPTQTATCKATAKDSNGVNVTSTTQFTFTANNDIASIDPKTGVVKGLKPGTASFTVTGQLPGLPAASTTAQVQVNDFIVHCPTVILDRLLTMTCTAAVVDASGKEIATQPKITFESSNTGIGTINRDTGSFEAVGKGETFISATAYLTDGSAVVVAKPFKVMVQEPQVPILTLDKTATTVEPNVFSEAVTAKVTNAAVTTVRWDIANNDGGATFESQGNTARLKATKPGQYLLRAISNAKPEQTQVFTVNVALPNVSITLEGGGQTIELNQPSQPIKATVTGTAFPDVTWTVTPDAGVTLTKNGNVATLTATQAGTYTVRAASVANPNKFQTTTITVKAAASTLDLTEFKMFPPEVGQGGTIVAAATFKNRGTVPMSGQFQVAVYANGKWNALETKNLDNLAAGAEKQLTFTGSANYVPGNYSVRLFQYVNGAWQPFGNSELKVVTNTMGVYEGTLRPSGFSNNQQISLKNEADTYESTGFFKLMRDGYSSCSAFVRLGVKVEKTGASTIKVTTARLDNTQRCDFADGSYLTSGGLGVSNIYNITISGNDMIVNSSESCDFVLNETQCFKFSKFSRIGLSTASIFGAPSFTVREYNPATDGPLDTINQVSDRR